MKINHNILPSDMNGFLMYLVLFTTCLSFMAMGLNNKPKRLDGIKFHQDTYLHSGKYDCKRQGCYQFEYVENEDYGIYSSDNSTCSMCQDKCSRDSNCGAVQCGGEGRFSRCYWWKAGKCIDDFHVYSGENYDFGYTCYKDTVVWPVNCKRCCMREIIDEAIHEDNRASQISRKENLNWIRQDAVNLKEYLETKKYCPSHLDNLCKKFKSELEENGIECDEIRAARLKAYLQWKCENDIILDKLQWTTGYSRETLKARMPIEDQLLPEHIRPDSYEVWLWVKKEPIILGNVTITAHVSSQSNVNGIPPSSHNRNRILLNSRSISISICRSCVTVEGKTVLDHGYMHDPLNDNHVYFIDLGEELKAGAKLKIIFTEFLSKINQNGDRGFYRVSTHAFNYTMDVTQLQAIDARRVFPCFDQPDMKATFQINIGRLKNLTSLSNMPKDAVGKRMENNTDYEWDVYQKTPIMSTYLIGMAVLFNHTSVRKVMKTRNISAWMHPQIKGSGRNTTSMITTNMHYTEKFLQFYDDYFNMTTIVPKIDSLKAFNEWTTAMENWGLIIYFKGYIASEYYVAHELGHLWFGNLVTCKNWTEVWLNEAFAEYISIVARWEVFGSKKLPNEEDVPDQSLYFIQKMKLYEEMTEENKQEALYEKGRPWRSTIYYIYSRGALFVRMLAATIGHERFQLAIRKYLEKYKFSNVDHEQLWAALEDVNPFKHTTISNIFNTWIMQRGVPYVMVSRCYKNMCKNRVSFKQRRYREKVENQYDPFPQVWYIPIRYAIISYANGKYNWLPSDNSSFQFLMPNTKREVAHEHQGVTSLDSKSALIVNINHTGMYHVAYDERNWKNIGSVLMANADMIPAATRLQLLWSLQMSLERKEINLSLMLCIGEYLKEESNMDITRKWLTMLFDMANYNIRPTASWPKYKHYLDVLLRGIHSKHCSSSELSSKKRNNFCNDFVKDKLRSLDNIAKEHCKLKTGDCKNYCEKYCDYFTAMDRGSYYDANCPKDRPSNQTEELLPTDKDIDDYLHKFMLKQNCRN